MDGDSQHCIRGSDQNHLQEKKCKKAKWLSEEALQIAEKRREVKGKGKRKDTPTWMQFQRIARRNKKAFLSEQGKEIEENNRLGKTVAQMVENPPAMRETWVAKIPWRRIWQPTPVFLPGKSPWTEEPGGLWSKG